MVAKRLKAVAVAIGLALSLSLVPVASANAAVAGLPPANTVSAQWLRNYCSYNGATDRYDLHGLFRAKVTYLSPSNAKYHQRVKLTVQYTEDNGRGWHTVDSKSRDSGVFRSRNLPTYTTPGIKTSAGQVYATGKIFRVRAIVKLKHVLPGRIPDTTKWRYTSYSHGFFCTDPSIGKS